MRMWRIAVGLIVLVCAAHAQAQTYPVRPVRIVERIVVISLREM